MNLVEGLPGDQHGHDYRLARTCGHLQGRSRQAGVVCLVLGFESLSPVRVALASSGHFCQEDGRFGSLSLTEQDAVLPLGICPVLKELTCDRGDTREVSATAPLCDVAAEIVNEAVLFASLTSEVKVETLLHRLITAALSFFGDRYRNERLARPSAVTNLARWPLWSDLVEPVRLLVWRVQNRIVNRRAHAVAILFPPMSSILTSACRWIHCATAAAVANTSAGMGRCSFQVIAMGFAPTCCT